MSMLKNNEQSENEIEDKYSVYMHISPSGKKYVGITKNKPWKRWDCGRGYKQCPRFWNAIQKYGWDNIEHIILYENLSCEKAKAIEIDLISKYDLTNGKNGYNISLGGDLGSKAQMKPIFMYDSITGKFLKKFNSCNEAERYFNKSGSNVIGKYCSENDYCTLYGYLWRTKYYPKIDVINKDKIILLFDVLTLKPIGNFQKLINNITHKGLTLRKEKIIACCNSKNYSYKNIFCCYLKDAMDLFVNYLSGTNHIKVVYQIDKDTNVIINTYFSYKEASRETGVMDYEIGQVCKHRYKTAGGYKWESVGIIKGEDIENKIKYMENNYGEFNQEYILKIMDCI